MELDWNTAARQARTLLEGWSQNDPGGVIAGFDCNGIRFSEGRGVANLGQNGPFNVDTVARWASVTKHVFADFVLGQDLPLDTPLQQLLPDMHPVPGAVTIRQALSMQGGLPDTRDLLTLAGISAGEVTTPDELLRWSGAIPRLNAPVGTEVAYSNAGYRLVEAGLKARGAVFADHVAQTAARLGTGMHASEMWSDPVPYLATGYVPAPDGWIIGGQGMHLSAAGSLSGSARDLVKWLMDLMGRDSLATLQAPVPLLDGTPTGYGLGLRSFDMGGRLMTGHGGAQSGYRSSFIIWPEHRIGIVVLSNRDDAAAGDMAEKTMASLVGHICQDIPAQDWAPPGHYVTKSGNLWAEVRPDSIILRDAEECLYGDGNGGVYSRAPQSQVSLCVVDGVLEGTVGHVPARLYPARAEPASGRLDGLWMHEGAIFRIKGEQLFWGSGPMQTPVTLVPLGGGRWLFNAFGRRICLRLLEADIAELSVSRARVVEYHRLA
ncbi:serine hydrolase [Falsirhodobacter sp. alg1]|uniref:serine hydrolase domain-containing protein n=1 Tax=Falsirhodobacter sp. alg1 TaxID=1472418 RepID=UPI0005F072B0|nr:serine hydrolase domain-containing protein [Falsirhodobacter sp. alg1]